MYNIVIILTSIVACCPPFFSFIPGLPTSSPSDHTIKDDDISPSAPLTVPRETSVHDRTFRALLCSQVQSPAGSG